MANASLDPIKAQLNSAEPYHPGDAVTFSDWTMQAGDTVKFKRGDTEYDIPVHSARTVWKGSPEISLNSPGNKARAAVARASKEKYKRGSGAIRNADEIRRSLYDAYNGLSSYLEFTASRLDVEFYGLYDGLYGELEMTRSQFSVEFEGLYDGLHGELVVTRSALTAEFTGLYDGLQGELTVTRSELTAEFTGLYDGLQGELTVTRSELTAQFTGLYDGLQGELTVTRSELTAQFTGLYDGLQGELTVTRSELTAQFTGLYDGLQGELTVTRSELTAQFTGLYDGLQGELTVTRSELTAQFTGMYDGLQGELTVTRSELTAQFTGMYDGLHGELSVTRSELTAQFTGLYDGLQGELTVTRSELTAQFTGMYDGLKGDLTVTRSQLTAQFTGMYDGLQGELDVTRSALTAEMSGMYDGLSGQLSLTRSEFDVEISNAYSGLSGKLDVQSSRIGMVVTSTGAIKAAEIAASIRDGGSDVYISADKIRLSGNTAISGILSVDNGALKVAGNGVFTGTSVTVTGTNATVYSTNYHLYSGGKISFAGAQQGGELELTNSTLGSMVKTMTLNSSTGLVTVTRFDGTSFDFRHAASGGDYVTGDWSGGVLSVAASPTGESSFIRTFKCGTVAWQADKKAAYVNVTAVRTSGGSTYDETDVFQVYVPTTESYNEGWGAAYGKVSIPSTSAYDSFITVYTPPSTVGDAAESTQFDLSVDKNYAYIFKHGNQMTLARVSNPQYGNGWTAAYGEVGFPTTQSYTSSFSVSTPPSTVDGAAVSTAFTLSVDKNYAYVQMGSNAFNVARVSNPQYGNGWSTAYGKVGFPTTQSYTSSFSVSTPPSTVDGTAVSTAFTLSVDKNYAYVKMGSNAFNVARVSNPQYGNGWSAAYDKVSIPSTSSYGSYTTVQTPPSTVDGNADETRFDLIVDDNYAYIQKHSNAQTLARVTNTGTTNGYINGWTTAYGKVVWAASGTGNTMTVKAPAAYGTTPDQQQKIYTLSVDNDYAYIKDGTTTVARATNTGTSNGYVSGWNGYWDAPWYTPAATPPSGYAAGKFWVPQTKSSATETTTFREWQTATNAWNTAVSNANSAGQTTGYNSAHLTSSWNANNDTLSITKSTSGSINAMSFAISASASITYNINTHKYRAVGQAKVDGTARGEAAGTDSGTEAYDAGYSNGSPVSLLLSSKQTGTIWYASITKNDNSAVSKTIDLSSAYTDARSGYYTKAQYDANWTSGYSSGSPSRVTLKSKQSGTTWYVTVTKTDSTTVDKTVDLASAYSDARAGYYTAEQYNANWTTGFNAGVPTGATLGTKVTGTVWNVSIARGSYAAVGKTIDLSSAYTDARSGYYTAAQYNARYNEGYIAGWAGYFNDSHWDKAFYNSSTKKYECWIPAKDVTWNGSAWVSSWDYSNGQNGWFQYTNSSGGGSSNPYPATKTMTCTGATFTQGQWKYTFSITLNDANVFKTNSTYKFHHNSSFS